MTCSLLSWLVRERYHSSAFRLGLLFFIGISPFWASLAQDEQQVLPLEPRNRIEREMSGGKSHSYRIAVASDQYLRVVLDQRGIDVVLALFAPDGKKMKEVDSLNGSNGPEMFSAIAERAGVYRVEVRALEKIADLGRYVIELEELRMATAADKDREAAGEVFLQAGQLRNGTLEEKRESIEKYQEALKLYRRAGDRSGEASTLNNIGRVYRSLGETQKALDKYNESLSIRRAIGDRRGEAESLNNIGLVYRVFGDLQKALENYQEALPTWRALGDRKTEAETLNNVGVAYQLLGEMKKSLETHFEALKIRDAVGDQKGKAITLSNIGQVYFSQGELQKALEYYSQTLPLRRAVGDRAGEAVTLTNLGSVYQLSGEMQKSIDNYNEALLVARAIGDRNSEVSIISSIGTSYKLLGEQEKALDKYIESLPILRAIGNRLAESQALNNIGAVYSAMGETEKALEKFNEALPISRAVGNRNAEAKILVNIGQVYQVAGETQKASDRYNEALTLARGVGDRLLEAAAIHNLGAIYQSTGELQKALASYNEALTIRHALGNRTDEAAILMSIAQVEQKRGNLSQSRQTIERAIGIIESLRSNLDNQELRTSYLASQQQFYEFYIDVLMQLHRQNPAAAYDAAALAVSERARARSLLELLAEARADIRQGVDNSLLDRERSLQQRLKVKAMTQVDLSTLKRNPAQAEADAKEIDSITAEYEEVEAQIRASSPRYAALTQPQPLTLPEIQQQVLDPQTLLLEYVLGEKASYLFVVSPTAIATYQLPKRAEIEAATRKVRELATAPQPRPGETGAERQARIRAARSNYWPSAAALSRILLGPAASQLRGKRLLIVADGALQYLPFGALPVPVSGRVGERESGRAGERENGRLAGTTTVRQSGIMNRRPLPHSSALSLFRSPTPLMVEHEIVHLPSASTLAVMRRELAGRQPAPKAVAVLADPVFSADDARVKPATLAQNIGLKTSQNTGKAPLELTRALNDVRGSLARLLMTRDEAEAILSSLPSNMRLEALDFRASRATGTSGELSQYRIVHFATHGLLNSEHPKLSGLVLSLVDERGEAQDGFLQLHEIFNLRLPAELVVLSACQTGLGKEIRGEGLVGLTRGFMYAGAARVMASLWQVDDAATAELMKRFYRRMLQGGKRPAAALREAQVEMWKRPQWQSPYYWGAFVLQGEWK
jgi:tetratricopeptide (TPR) repeat protein